MKKKTMFFFLCSVSIMLFIFYLLIISIKNNPISLRNTYFNNREINALLPEGWAFFTRNPREETVKIYSIGDDGIKEKSIKSSDPSQFFGTKRDNRLIISKIDIITANINDDMYYQYRGALNNIILDSISEYSVPIKEPCLCGNYLISKGSPIPWSWYSSTLNEEINVSNKFILINFKCQD